MKPYEAVIIYNSGIPEDKIDASISKFEKKIRDIGGTEINTTKWGIKKLASPFKRAKGSSDGYYVMIKFISEGKVPNELKSLLNVSEDVLRYSVFCSRPPEKETREEKVEIEPSMILPASPEQSGSQGEIPA